MNDNSEQQENTNQNNTEVNTPEVNPAPGSEGQTALASSPKAKAPLPRRQRTMLVRYGKMGNMGQFRHSERDIPAGTSHVVVKTERGMEIGEIVSPFCHKRGSCMISNEKMDKYYKESGPNYPVSRHGTVVRFASDMDLKDQRHLDADIKEKLVFCRQLIKKMNLPMHLIDAEHLFGGERMIFYFMADGRVDFRDLVKELAHQYQTRIEMRQVGARDEARLTADFETCGRQCCCKNYLKVLQPVNMRMAKLQKATLDPSKISGRCGRLKCCLRYEDEVYNELNKRLPRRNTRVLTDKGPGTVMETQVLTQLVKIRLENNERVIAINVDEIMEMNYKGQPSSEPQERVTQTDKQDQPEPAGAEEPPLMAVDQESAPAKDDKVDRPEGERSDTQEKTKKRHKGRRRRKKRK